MWELFNYPLIDPSSAALAGYSWMYTRFNLLEATIWFGVAAFIFVRYARYRKTWYELQYAAAFILFGFTDILETHATTLWLLAFKGACLLAILLGRKLVLESYPTAKF